ncbi:MAG: hypothetical protein MR966_07900 [Lachnospiraceae bacterium]|nr:hypothetical protein [Lachnospiraceae bacterium]
MNLNISKAKTIVNKDVSEKILKKEYNTTERSVTINYCGYAQAYFYLCSSSGKPLKNTKFSFTITQSAGDGTGNIYEYNDRETDEDGGYGFGPPDCFTYESGSSNKYKYVINITSVNGDKPDTLHDTFTLNVSVNNIEYTETWTFGLTSSLSKDLTKSGEITVSAGGTGTISLAHRSDYTEDLTLSVKLPISASGKFKTKAAKLDNFSIGIGNISGETAYSLYETYSTTIEDFDPLDKEDREVLASYLCIIFNESMANNVLLREAFMAIGINDMFTDFFEESESGVEIVTKAGGSAVKGTITSKTSNPGIDVNLFSPLQLGAGSCARTYNYVTGWYQDYLLEICLEYPA